MDTKIIIESTKKIIGKNKDNDYILNPSEHTGMYEKEAPELAKVLKATEIVSIAKEYKRWDIKANNAQNVFKRWSGLANGAIFLTAFFTAGLVASGIFASFPNISDAIINYTIGTLSVASIVSSFSAGICIRIINKGNLLGTWMKDRAEAETQRLYYFDLITHDTEEDDKKYLRSTLLKLEYFRRFQLDVQLIYYKVRGKEHKLASSKAQTLMLMAMGLVTLINGLAGVLGIIDEKLVIFSAVALISNAFATKIGFTEAVNQDKRNAERYERTWSILNNLWGKLDEVRIGITKGKYSILNSYVESVHEQLSLEHRQWLDEFEKRSDAIGRLESQLESLKEV